MNPLSLPPLVDELSKYYGSCTFISPHLIEALRELLPSRPHLILSIGSGFGLVEALVTQNGSHSIECVEVPSLRDERKYVQESSMHYVSGTWATCDRAQNAAAWVFLFPREPRLLAKYIEEYRHEGLQFILWIGPAGDAAETLAAVSDATLCAEAGSELAKCLYAGEAMILWRRRVDKCLAN